MPKVMIINVTHSEESRVGIINEGLLESFEIESQSRSHLKGNIYKGVIHRIHPALEAAFVDIGGDRDAFLPLDEICFRNLDNPPGPQSRSDGDNGRRKLRIRDVLQTGQEVLVQITKEQFANKPPTLTTFYSLPGRYLVLMPGGDDTGISRRIEGDDRIRLRKLVRDLNLPNDFGVIVRTVAGLEDAGRELQLDLEYLQRLWGNVREAAGGHGAPSLVYREHDIVLRTIRDFFTPDIDDIYIDDEEVYERAREFLDSVMPSARASLHLYQGEQPIFSAFKVESQIETVFKRRVPLRSGGSIVVDGTEALTAIDVNSGGSVRGANPEETAFRTNQEAAREVARQLRLRDIGGLIVVDFIDMRDSRHNQEVENLMRENMHIDKARHEVGQISGFGLMQISRQRLRPAATTTTYISCPMCEGHGSVRTVESAALAGLRKIHNRISLGDVESMRVAVPTGVAAYLLNQKRDELARLESRYRCTIHVELREDLMPHEMEIDTTERSADAPRPEAAAAGVVTAPADSNGANGSAGSKRPRRRRGRRRGGRSRGNGAATEETQSESARDEAQSAPAVAEANGGDTAEAAQATASAAAPENESSGEERSSSEEGRTRSGRGRRRSSRGRGRGRGRRSSGATESASTEQQSSGTTGDGARSHRATVEQSAERQPSGAMAQQSDNDAVKKPMEPAAEKEATAGSPPDVASTETAEAKKKPARSRTTKSPATKRTTTARKKAASTADKDGSDEKKTAKPARKAATKKRAASATKRTRKTTKKTTAKKTTKTAAKSGAETVA